MTPQQAIEAHRLWKDRFRANMATRELLDIKCIAADDCCDFGRWLHDDGRWRYGHVPVYAECVALHAAFHREAARVAEALNAGHLLEAEQMLASRTPYAEASQDLIRAVVALFNSDSHPTQSA